MPRAQVFVSAIVESDHVPIVINTHTEDKKGKRRFRFEAMWVTVEGCGKVIKETWNKINGEVLWKS